MSVPRVWPEGYQCAATITVDFDGESVEARSMDLPLWGRNSYGRYGAQVGLQRLLALFQRFGVTATFFIPGWDAERYPAAMEAIATAGHEVAGHGYLHEDFSALTRDQQAEALERSEAALERVFGRKPSGWRAPDGLMTTETRSLLASRGYRYDSSYNDDDVPYVVSDQQGNRLVELPVHEPSSDRYYYSKYRMPDVVAAGLREELSATYEVGGLFNLVLHPRGDYGSGRGSRIRAVAAVLQSIREYPGIWVATCGQVADWMLERTEGASAG